MSKSILTVTANFYCTEQPTTSNKKHKTHTHTHQVTTDPIFIGIGINLIIGKGTKGANILQPNARINMGLRLPPYHNVADSLCRAFNSKDTTGQDNFHFPRWF